MLDRTRHSSGREIDTRCKTGIGRGIIDEVAQGIDATRISNAEDRTRKDVVIEALYRIDDCRQRNRLRRVEPDVEPMLNELPSTAT